MRAQAFEEEESKVVAGAPRGSDPLIRGAPAQAPRHFAVKDNEV